MYSASASIASGASRLIPIHAPMPLAKGSRR